MTWNKMWNIHFLKSHFLQDYSSLFPFKYSSVLLFSILCNNSVLPLSPYFTISSPIFSQKVFLITHYMSFSHSSPHVWQKALGQFLYVKSSTMVGFQHKLKSPSKIKHLWSLHPTVVSFPLAYHKHEHRSNSVSVILSVWDDVTVHPQAVKTAHKSLSCSMRTDEMGWEGFVWEKSTGIICLCFDGEAS